MDMSEALTALEALSSSISTSSSGPLNALLDEHFARARQRIIDGDDPKVVITDLQKAVTRAKKDVEKGLKGWYAALNNVGKSVEKVSGSLFPDVLMLKDRRSHLISRQFRAPTTIRHSSMIRCRDKRWTGSYWKVWGVGDYGTQWQQWKKKSLDSSIIPRRNGLARSYLPLWRIFKRGTCLLP